MIGRSLRFHFRRWFAEARAVLKTAVLNFIANNDLLWASALTYRVALTIVPALALGFLIAKRFGAVADLQPIIAEYLVGLSPRAHEQLMTYVSNASAAAVGTVGAAFLVLTVASTMSTIEDAFNQIWLVPESRTYTRKFVVYLGVLITVPALILAALTITATFSTKLLGLPASVHLVPYFIEWVGFFFLFILSPNTRVKPGPALLASFLTAVLFQIAQWGYVHFQVGVARYRVIYGALAAIPVFLVWIYIAWGIILFGAEVSAAAQGVTRRSRQKSESPDFAYAAAMHILVRLAERYLQGGEPITVRLLAAELQVGEATVAPVLKRLRDAGLVVEGNGRLRIGGRKLFIGRAPEVIKLDEVLACAAPQPALDDDRRVGAVLARIECARRQALGSLTLREIVDSGPR